MICRPSYRRDICLSISQGIACGDRLESILHNSTYICFELEGVLYLCFSTLQTGTVDSLTAGATVGIVLACTAVIIFSVGISVGVLIYNCVSKQRSQSPKPDSSLSHQQEQIVSSNSLQQTNPEYAEVIKLRQNRAYEQTVSSSDLLQQTSPGYAEVIKLRQNRAYEQTVSSSILLQQTSPEYAEVIKLRQNRAYELTHAH